jgi:cell division septation protein DedD
MEEPTKHKRFYFYRDQLVVIALAFAMTAAIILVLGMITGKTIVRRRAVERPASVKIPVKPPPASADWAPEAEPDNNFVSQKDSKKAAAVQPSDREPPRGAKPQEKSAKSDTINPTAQIKEPAKIAPQAAATPGEKAASAPTSQDERQVSPVAKKDLPDQIWTIQVKSSTDKTFADQWVNRLKAKGHEAYVVEADVKGQTWYRIRVGQLNTRQEAETLQSALESQEGLSGTFLLKAPK